MSTSRGQPQVALKDRIAALQQRKDGTSTSTSASSSTIAPLKPQLTGPAGSGPPRNNLRDKIAKFEEKGGTPIPRGSFGIGAPPPEEGGRATRNRELYGNRVSALGKGHLGFVPQNLATQNRAVTAPTSNSEEGAGAGAGGRPQARKRYSSSLSLAGIPDGAVTSHSTGNIPELGSGLGLGSGGDDLAPLTPDYTGASTKSAPAWRSNNRRSVIDIIGQYDVMDFMTQIPPTPTRGRTMSMSDGGFSSPDGPRSPISASGGMDNLVIGQDLPLHTLMEDTPTSAGRGVAEELEKAIAMGSETGNFDPSPVVVTSPEGEDGYAQESVVKSSPSQTSSLPTPPPDENSVSFPSNASPEVVQPVSPLSPPPPSSPSKSSSPSLSSSPEPVKDERSGSSSTLRLSSPTAAAASPDEINQKSTDGIDLPTEGVKPSGQDLSVQSTTSQPELSSTPASVSTLATPDMAIPPPARDSQDDESEAQFITISSSSSVAQSQGQLPDTPTTATAATFRLRSAPTAAASVSEPERSKTTATRTIIPPPRTSSMSSSSSSAGVDSQYNFHSRETSTSTSSSDAITSPSTPIAKSRSAKQVMEDMPFTPTTGPKSFSAVVHRKTTEPSTTTTTAAAAKSSSAPNRTKSTSDNGHAIRSKRNFKHLNNTTAATTNANTVPTVVEPPATPNASELQALLRESAILEQRLMQGDFFEPDFGGSDDFASGLVYGGSGTSKSAIELSRFSSDSQAPRRGRGDSNGTLGQKQRLSSTPALSLQYSNGGASDESAVPPTPPPKGGATRRFQSLRSALKTGTYPRNSVASMSEDMSSEDSIVVATPPSPTFELGMGGGPSSFTFSRDRSQSQSQGSISSHSHGRPATGSSTKSIRSVKSGKSTNGLSLGMASLGGSFKSGPRKGVQRAATFADRLLGKGGRGKRGQDNAEQTSANTLEVSHGTPVRHSAAVANDRNYSHSPGSIKTSGATASLAPSSPSRSMSMMSLSASSAASSPNNTASFEFDRDIFNEFPSVPQELPTRPSLSYEVPASAPATGVFRSTTMPTGRGAHHKASTDLGYVDEEVSGRTSQSTSVPWLKLSQPDKGPTDLL
ncbi:uncharacterized protein STEHIDRAFT_118796 [Stereum hirsutum FP-91666 SS1]|uniref:uncharacterized protein n=1 Tax=Stereum hirsutum (strain FP-91666) TaxID=721885 RepID=UPI000440DA3C|nr:uncharacterized protein STEHIDRAFT_118796 [Stereum hirsutum FP-91666 SS1]EIM89646.1 hypothetical protein STEHIDRAFT_118796 [Stereum hirsutum FP-91666 SS1]